MKKKLIAAGTAVTLMLGIFTVYASPAENLQDKGIFDGYEDGELHLERTLTRAEFAKIFTEAFLKDTAETDLKFDFPDVKKDFWGREYIDKAVRAGVISGFDDGKFHPDEKITYEQAVKMIVQYCEKRSFDYPAGYVSRAVENGISDNVTALIGDTITRGETACLIENTINYIEEKEQDDNYEQLLFSSMLKSESAGGGGGSGSVIGGYVPNYAVTEGDDSDDGESVTGASPAMPMPDAIWEDIDFNTEEYSSNAENVFKNAVTSPLSTFSIDTDTASYSNMRRYILRNQLPPNGSIRTEELINYFDYDNPLPTDGTPFAVSTEVSGCPWNTENNLAMISIQGDELTEKQPSNLVFLLDVSGSMYGENRLPLVKKSLKLLLEELDEKDTVSIVTYASGTGVKLESTPVSEKDKIIEALDALTAGGSTYGEAGITLAYEQAEKNLVQGNNRIILCSDGDFNVGRSSTGELEKLITEKRDKGIFLTVLGFGMGNYKDNRMEMLADKGNGNYAYIDSEREAKKVFVDEMPKTLYTIAKDVKIQVEFNPAVVKEYRLVGYENRKLNNEDFDNDKKDAGELGCGASVTAFYELVPADGTESSGLKYQTTEINGSDELMTVKVRYKDPDGTESKLIETPVNNIITDDTSDNFRFAAALAELGMILNNSEYKGTSDIDSVVGLASESIGEDKFGFRTELLHLADLMKYIPSADF